MSAPHTVESPPKPEVKQKPPLPSKSANGTSDTPPTVMVTPATVSGNVLKMVSRFNQPDVQSSSSSASESRSNRKSARRAPTVKPRPKVTFSPKSRPDQAPPLPIKRKQTLKESEQKGRGQTVAEGQGGAVIPGVTNHSRSDPDGREVEQRSVRPRPEQKPSSSTQPQCASTCSCLCHLHRPGMKLVWVPVSAEEEEGEEKEVRQDSEAVPRPEGDHEERAGEGESETSDSEEEEEEEEEDMELQSEYPEEEDHEEKAPLTNKAKFKATLNLIEGQLRRRSDPGVEVTLMSFNPVPQVQTNLTKAHSVSEEESIYEVTLDVLAPPRDTSEKTLSIVPPLRPTKGATECSAPAIPPRMPVEKGRNPRLPRSMPRAQLQVPSHPSMDDSLPSSSPKPLRSAPSPPTKASGRRSSSPMSKDEVQGSSAGDEEKQEKKPSAGLTRQKSLDMEASMPQELLYQMYNESYITREIRRQTVCRNISKTSADYQMEHPRIAASSGSGAGGPRSSPVPSLMQGTLWRDLPAVQESGILQTLTPEDCKYQESIFEVLTSEVSYLRSLRVLTEHFMDSRELNDILINREKKTLFSNILRIREVSEKFLKDLEDRLDESLLVNDICDIINYHAQHNFPAYIDYVRNQIYQEKTYSSLMQSNTQFATVIARLQETPKCQRLPFASFLLLPFQRITRIKILIENILKRTAEGTKEEESASKALASVSKIIEECNTQVGKMKQMEELIEINKMLEFDKLKAVPVISQNRFLEKRGDLQEIAKGATLFNLKPKFSPVFLFLFNDLLIIATKKGVERYVVMDHAHRSLVQVQEHTVREDSASPSLENCFSLTLLENHQGRMMERLLKAPTQSDMHRWLAAFPNPDDPHREQDEVVYDDWDCPQVQCVQQYVAKQTDELNLEPPEIINVIRKTNEGWYQGIRMSDGQKGWFPLANVLEITNEHVRRRNLRERYRVMQAASNVTNKPRSVS